MKQIKKANRFQDKTVYHYHFANIILVHCPKCNKKATIKDFVGKDCQNIEISCEHCGYFKSISKEYPLIHKYNLDGTDFFFKTNFWLKKEFKGQIFWAYNYNHLAYLKEFIQAKVRLRVNNKVSTTMIENLPSFIKSKKNRESLLKIISKLEQK